ncbi:MAG TPA: FG-GAP-like repeat-containing protein [Gemmatimonadaceae bacterium]|nr:FG-GAP-like repeat-containing protein [Gemmatimonadaceae bacterium]
MRIHTCRRDGRSSALAALLAAGLVVVVACGPRPTPPWHQEAGYRWRELDVPHGDAGFTTLSGGRTGITFQNAVGDSLLLGNRVLGQGGGVALGDVDGDGLTDVFLARTDGCSALYRNLGGWKFADITKSAGVGACDRHSSGAAFADVDGDGDLDLILLATTGPNAIFLNDGKGHFTERRDLGLDTTGLGGTTVTMADIDGSGRLALYVANYKPFAVEDSLPPQERTYQQLVHEVAPGRYEVAKAHARDFKLVMRPDMGGLRMTQRGSPNELYLNDGAGHFRLATPKDARLRDASGKPVTEEAESFSLGARFVDLDGDGAPDLYVANDFEDTDQLWFNDGTGNFRLADWTSQRQMSNSTMGIDVADVNGDGRPDLFAVDMLANDTHRLRTQMPTSTDLPKTPGATALQLQQQRNTLFVNRGDRTFAELGQYAGVDASGWSWSTMFLDVDLDGWPDILVANGHLWDVMDGDVQEAQEARPNAVAWQRSRWQFPKLALKNVAFRNRGDLTFEDVSAKWGFGTEADVSNGMAMADLDGDGDLDVIVNRLGSPALVLRNNSGAPRVAVRLHGSGANTQAVGARIHLEGGAVPEQVREVAVGGLYLSHSDYLATFAMGASPDARLVVDWRDGRRTTIAGVKPNRLYEITDSSAVLVARETAKPDAPIFADATAELRGHTHAESPFDDWGRQYLLPSALSPLGPGVAWFDVDRDGAEDLVVGAGKGGRLAVFRNVDGHLTPLPGAFPAAPMSLTAVIGLADESGTRILAGVSTWQALAESVMVKTPSVLSYPVRGTGGAASAPARADAAIPSHASSTGPIAVADYDGDGRLDLFVGSRAIPMQYPLPPSSGLFRNVGGRFVFDSANAAVLNNVGMVSAAMFADINGDGSPDLVLARDWGSILLLLNDGHGRFTPAPWHLDEWTSRWNGIAAGDVDGDGRLDLIATSWGRNTKLRTDAANPLTLLYGPVGAAQEQEMLLARNDPRVGGLAALNGYARVRVAIPAVANSVRTFGEWADATVDRALGADMGAMSRLTATTLDNMVFLNRGDHFEAVPLPAEAQYAPAFYAGVADFDGDGSDDLFLAQNFSETMVGWPRDDAGRGLLLLNDGKGNLTPAPASRSGIVIYGDQRGAAYADFDGDGRVDLAVSQNAGPTRLFRNRGARPGLRVRVRGPATNPDAIGAQVRVVFGARMSPVREIQAGGGYWSENGAVQVFGLPDVPTEVWVRWPGGRETRTPVPKGAREVVVTPSR